ncbi:MAG: hypothetical protein J5998_12095 [Clostridia bacterium]|nr:hypothetical protein [Clostridia bacterium]
MKKWMTVLVAVMLVLSMTTAFAAGVPSKTSTTTTTIVGMETVSGDPLPEGFGIEVGPDTAMTIGLIESLGDFVSEGGTPIDFFEPEVQTEILAHLNANKAETEALTLDDLKDWQINEIISVDAKDYDPETGDVIVTFEFATPYQVGQKMVGILDCFNGQRVEVEPNVFEFVSEKIILDAEVKEAVDGKGQVAVTFTKDALVKMQDSVASALSILSEPAK